MSHSWLSQGELGKEAFQGENSWEDDDVCNTPDGCSLVLKAGRAFVGPEEPRGRGQEHVHTRTHTIWVIFVLYGGFQFCETKFVY